MANMEIANTILNQLGGNYFIAMTGAKNFVADQNSLRMRIGRNASKANIFTVVLLPDDTYKMIFRKYTSGRLNRKTGVYTPDKITDIAVYENVYCDQLQDIFTEVTGMYTHL